MDTASLFSHECLRGVCMTRFTLSRLLAFLRAASVLMLFAPGAVNAHEYYADGFIIVHPWAVPTAQGTVDVPVYFHLTELSKGDRLIRGFSPLAERVEFRAGDDPAAPALTEIAFRSDDEGNFGPGKPHLLLRGLKVAFEEGRSYMLMLEFERAGQIVMVISVGPD